MFFYIKNGISKEVFMSIDWSKLPEKLQKYKKIKPLETLIDLSICNDESLIFLSDQDARSQAYNIFIHNYNEIQMNANFQTNLYLAEEFHHLANGSNVFGFEIPTEYYGFPSVYDNQDIRACLEVKAIKYETFGDIIGFCKANGYNMVQSSTEIITKTLKRIRERQKINLPENMVFEYINKNEFLSLFSIFEAFLEDFCIEKQKKHQLNNEEEIRKDINKKLRTLSFKESIIYVLNLTNGELVNLLMMIRIDLLNILGYMGLIRNLHVHHLGIITERYLNMGKDLGVIKQGFDNVTKIDYYYEEILLSGEHRIEIGQYITLTRLVSQFRFYIKEIAFMLDACF